MSHITPVILSGGTGSRLWPLSREAYPKQLLPLLGQRSLLQEPYRGYPDRRFSEHLSLLPMRSTDS